jgi:phosphatidylglycerol lysyltransferase
VPPALPRRRPKTEQSASAAEPETIGHLALLGDKHLLFDDARASFVMFALQGSSWITMGDPVGGPEDARRELVWRFREQAERAGGRAVFYQVDADRLGWYVEAGFSLIKVGEEARVDLRGFTLEGPERRRLRSAVRRLEREGVSF